MMAPTFSSILTPLAFISVFLLSSKAYPFAEELRHLARQNISPQDRSQQVRNAIVEAGFEFIESQSNFAVGGKCKTDTRNIDAKNWENRFGSYKQAIQDATQIAQGRTEVAPVWH